MTNKSLTAVEPIALFGGTFDPVHYGHLRCADEAREKLKLSTLYLLPAGTPVHRDVPQATVTQRLDMLQLAREEFPHLMIDDREARRSGPSYMVETLQELRASFAERPLILLVGQDAANLLHTWFHWEQLFELAHIVILTRPATHIEYEKNLAVQLQTRSETDGQSLLESKAGSVLQLEVEPIDVSATAIKRIIRSGGSPESMLPQSVLEYITENRLYLAD